MRPLLKLSAFSRVRLFATPWTVAGQAPLSMGFSRQEDWGGLPCASSGDLLDPGTEHASSASPALQTDSLLLNHWGSPCEAPREVKFSSVQFSWVAQSCLTLCNPMDCSTSGFPVHHQLPELAQTHVYQVGDALQPSHPPSSPSPPAFSLSQHQGLFQWVGSSYQVAKWRQKVEWWFPGAVRRRKGRTFV